MRRAIIVSVLLVLSLSPQAFGASLKEKLQRAQQTERVDKLNADNKANINQHVSKPDIIVRLNKKPDMEEISGLTSVIAAQSSSVTAVRYAGLNIMQVTLDRPFTQKQMEAFRAELKGYDVVLDVEFISPQGNAEFQSKGQTKF